MPRIWNCRIWRYTYRFSKILKKIVVIIFIIIFKVSLCTWKYAHNVLTSYWILKKCLKWILLDSLWTYFIYKMLNILYYLTRSSPITSSVKKGALFGVFSERSSKLTLFTKISFHCNDWLQTNTNFGLHV